MKIRFSRFFMDRTVLVAAVASSLIAVYAGNPAKAFPADAPSSYAVMKASSADLTETRINRLHDKLCVSQEQEALWREVARVMRENAARMESLIVRLKSQPRNSRNAVDDIKAYGEIVAAHADGIQTFIPVFEAFYASLTDEQRTAVESEGMEF